MFISVDENITCIEVDPGTDTVPLNPSPLPPKKKVLEPKRRKAPARKGKTTKNTIKFQYYRKKLECAMVEKKKQDLWNSNQP